MLNLVTGPEAHAAAVLIRAAEPVEGHTIVAARRGGIAGPRVGIGYATPEDQAAPWRVAGADSAWVSVPKGFLIEPEKVGRGGSG